MKKTTDLKEQAVEEVSEILKAIVLKYNIVGNEQNAALIEAFQEGLRYANNKLKVVLEDTVNARD
jgi:hypothetical protein